MEHFPKRLLMIGGFASLLEFGLLSTVTVPPIRAQAQPSSGSEFEVSSVKRWAPTGRGMSVGVSISGPRVTFSAMGLTGLIEYAYDLKPYQIMGGPSWLDSERYDIAAKVEGESIPTKDQVRRMLQTLLSDRFQLEFHRDTKQIPVYALVVGKGGPKLKDSSPDAEESLRVSQREQSMDMTVTHGTMEQLALNLSSRADRPVVNRTGLAGHYDYKITGWTPEKNSADSDATSSSSILAAVEDQLGLKLDPQKASVPIFVIDHVAKPEPN
jgi:uncharacterized protein (TIGR03435 family)